MKRLILTLITMGVVALPSLANDGYVYNASSGYYQDAAGNNYTRERYYQPGCYNGGCYTNGYYFYKYYAVPAYTPPALPSYKDPGWRAELIRLAKQRDAFEGQIRKDAFDHAQYLEAIAALGLQGNFTWNGYGAVPPYSNYGSLQFSSAGVNGSSVYGYSVQSVANLYGTFDLNAAYQQASRLTENAQQLAGQAHADTIDAFNAAGRNQARVAEILARGEAARNALEGTKPPPEATVITKGSTTVVGPAPVPPTQPVPRQPAPPLTFPRMPHAEDQQQADPTLGVTASCVSCHGASSPKAGLSLLTTEHLTSKQRQEALTRIFLPLEHPNHMPPRGKPQPSPAQRLELARLLGGK